MHYCTLDLFAYGIGWAWVGSHQEAAADRAVVKVTHEIDGVTVDYTVTAAKRVITFGEVWGWTPVDSLRQGRATARAMRLCGEGWSFASLDER